MRRALRLLLLAASILLLPACEGGEKSGQDGTGTKPAAAELPPLKLTDATENLLLTWIDDKGDFHVVQKISDVPDKARSDVRVVVTNKVEGTGKLVYVADLSKKQPDGSYAVRTMTRAAWDEKGASKRKARLEALAPPPSGSAPSASPDAGGAAAAKLVVIIYGAHWCRPCHDAAAYLKKRGVTVVQKDIEKNQLAATEMRDKLKRAGRSGASIPVIDVMGQILIGFSPRALDRAVETARNARTL